MKRILILAAAALAVCGCSKDPLQEAGYDTSKVVGFTTGPVTRGTPVTDESQMTDIGVFCSYTGAADWTAADVPAKMFDRKLVRGISGAWNYDDGTPEPWNANAASDRYTFFAYAPYAAAANGIVVNGSASTAGVPALTYTVPVDVTEQPDLMVAVARKNIRPNPNPVALQMEHALTCVGFQIAGDNDRIKGIAVTGVSVTGTLAMDGSDIVWSDLGPKTAADYSASINYDDGQSYYTATSTMSTALMKGNGYLMMIPQTLDADAKVVITKSNNATVEVSLDTRVWAPGAKVNYHITLTPAGILLVTEPPLDYPYDADRSQYYYVESHTANNSPIAWIAEFSTDEGGHWAQTPPEWLMTFTSSGSGGSSPARYIAQVAAIPGVTTNVEDDLLQAAPVEGSAGNPVDLSMRLGRQNTANSYIVNAAGYYKLPLVYGNARKDGADYPDAYTSSATAGTALPVFLRHDNQPIADPFIYNNGLTPVEAVLVWQDAPDLLSDIRLINGDTELAFTVPAASVAQGNAIVAVRDAGGAILWSWHIWVTPLVDAAAPATDRTRNFQGVTYDFMKYNLGWCTGPTTTYGEEPRTVKVRITQTGISTPGTYTFTITQENGPTKIAHGNNPFWQWGRKDPLPPSNGLATSTGRGAEKTIYGNYTYGYVSDAATLGEAIQNPTKFYYSSSSRNWCSAVYYNLWSVSNVAKGASDTPVVKTVYDPSPVGFSMPPSNAWKAFTTTGTINTTNRDLFNVVDNTAAAMTANGGWEFYLYSPKNNPADYKDYGTVLYQASGYRVYNTGQINDAAGTQGYYWSAMPFNDISGQGMNFHSGRVGPMLDYVRACALSIRCAAEQQ